MRIEDCDSAHDVEKPADIATVLSKRRGIGGNSFWMGQTAGGFPAINIMVNGGLACLHYFPKEGHPGFSSVGGSLGLNPEGYTIFHHDGTEETSQIMNDAVVPFSDALRAAQEFAISKTMPKCIEWESLIEGD
jgi:hypothetical protein